MLYANNLFNFVSLLYDKEKKALGIDWEDEIVKGTLVTKGGAIVHPDIKRAGAPPAAKAECESKAETPAEENDG